MDELTTVRLYFEAGPVRVTEVVFGPLTRAHAEETVRCYPQALGAIIEPYVVREA